MIFLKSFQYNLRQLPESVRNPKTRCLHCSSGRVFDPYLFEDIRKRPPVWTPSGIGIRLSAYKGHLKSSLSAGFIQKHCPEFAPKRFPPVADRIFHGFVDAHRKGDLSGLSYLATKELFESVKDDMEMTNRKPASLKKPRLAFKILRMVEPTYILQMRHAMEKGSSRRKGWGQVTCQFVSEREIVGVDKRGNEVQFDSKPNRIVESITIGVLEVYFGDPKGQWRLAMLHEVGQTEPSKNL